ncbi:uncharacterized protein LOC113230016 isoform X2 [Hyposmocoma kahamanoa]|uniref:uncharacterized protein LOC113230016 isoform X2 n=1 Tax=Hyposmocoma kahamanoa TaxID=1477025 RepID=UPI000E6D8ECD|nr:uncharacterized protein LOC113230016 isoform X2 [Hyposmocoma kahamanoa]
MIFHILANDMSRDWIQTRLLFTVSRNLNPSSTQLEKLVDLMETKRWLATGHARTANARNRSRAAWQEIADALNSGGSGCIKSWQQWCKNESAMAVLGDIISPLPGPSQPVVTAEIEEIPGPLPVTVVDQIPLSEDSEVPQPPPDELETTDNVPSPARRLLHRSPPSQRRSEMVSLTERFIAIEEGRAEAELIVARSHELYAQSQQAMVGAVVQLAQAFNALAENFVRANNNN